MACVRFKRALTEGDVVPSPMIIVKRRRLCSDRQDDPCSPRTLTADEKSDSNGKNLFEARFKFVGTVDSKDEDIDPLISRAVVRECQASGGHFRRKQRDGKTFKKTGAKRRVKDDHRHRRRRDFEQQQKAVSTEARYRLVSALRDVDADVSPSKSSDAFDETVKGLYTLYDVEKLSVCSNLKSKEPLEQITCNGIAMICEEKPRTKFVYDLYFMHDCNVQELESTQDSVCIEPCFDNEAQDLVDESDSDSATGADEDDDDSNEENNWRNDYPEEDDDFEKGNDYYRDYGDADEELIEELESYAIGSDKPRGVTTSAIAGRNFAPAGTNLDTLLESMMLHDSSDGEEILSRSFEENERLHGRTYAEYKARMKSYVDCGTSGDVLSDTKSSNAFE